MPQVKYRVRIFFEGQNRDVHADDLLSDAEANHAVACKKSYHWGQTLVQAETDSQDVAIALKIYANLHAAKSSTIEEI